MKKLLFTSAAVVATMGLALAGEKPPAEHVQWMKDIGANFGAIRKNVEVEKNANAMAETMKAIGGFWKGRNSEVAMKTCGDTRKGALEVAKAAAANDAAGVAAGIKMIGGGCKGCHDQHREKISDTENLIK
ncbi:MAG: cytochrome c [Bryobacterales bacterium]|nr:cytochrome c [Bryobacterales bacterium]